MTAAVELRMPLGYVEMGAEEMEYMEGGSYSIKQSTAFLSKAYCLGYATGLKLKLWWWNISAYDLAAELYGHARAWYSPLTQIGNYFGWGFAQMIHSAVKSIEVDNHVDTHVVKGVTLYKAFRVIYAWF